MSTLQTRTGDIIFCSCFLSIKKQQYKEKNIAKRIEYQKYIYPLAVLLQYQFYETIFLLEI